MTDITRSNNKALIRASEATPCPHCGKPDWCYRIGELTVCKRPNDPAPGWEKTTKTDKDGTPYYAPKQINKDPRVWGSKDYIYHDRQGNKLVKVTRTDRENGRRSFYQSHFDNSRQRWIKGVPEVIKSQIPLYRHPQVRKNIERGRTIFLAEGEGCADALCGLGLQGTTAIGGSGKYRTYGSYKEDLEGADLVLCPDRDKPGIKHMEEIAKDFPNARWLYAPPSDHFWQHLPESGGLDIFDWIKTGATAEDIKAAIGEKIYSSEPPKVESDRPKPETEQLDFTLPNVEEIFTQKAIAALFSSTKWICLNGHLHRWDGKHYALVDDSVVKASITRWCASTPVRNLKGEWLYSYAQSRTVDNIWNWASLVFGIDPALINPPGINCLNGSLKLHWEGRNVTWKLYPHDPNDYYIHVSQFNYNPKADPTQCDRLLACLEPEQQDIYLKTLAASLDLSTIRKYLSRVKAIICQGHGNNGKDSLREAATYLYSSGMTSATISDFQIYDGGKKFPLAKLEHSLINWSSENSSFKNLDTLESLKAAITGEDLAVERKNLDERPMRLDTVFLFNMNESPNLQAGSEAIQSRWAILTFDKTYKVGADPSKGELEADARFRYDPEFLQTEVVPALLNKILEALPRLMTEGINYDCTQKALENIQQETNHLWAFAKQTGLDYQQGGRVYINELWERLKTWYIANGTLEIRKISDDKEKQEWHDQVNNRDKNIKGANQIYQRFAVLFPKISRHTETQITHRKGQAYLEGIAISEAVGEAGEAISEPVGEAVARSQSGGEPGEPVEATLVRLLNALETLNPLELREMLIKIKNRGQLEQTGSLDSLALIARAVASPTGSLTGSPSILLSTDEVQNNTLFNSVQQSPVTISQKKSSENINKVGSDNNQSVFLPPAPSCFKVGDRVAHINPNDISHDWHGTILEINTQSAKVRWDERKRMRGGQVLRHKLAELRHIEEK